MLAGSARAVAASRWSAAVPVEDHDGGVVAEVAAGGAQNRGAERVDHIAGMQVAGLAEGGGDVEVRGVAFKQAIGDKDRPVVHESFLRLVHRPPPGLRIVAATRRDPPWPLHRLRPAGALAEIRAADLAVREDEAACVTPSPVTWR